jgi:hypothetical protein
MRKIRAYPQVRSCSQLPNTYTAHPNTETTANIVAKTKYSHACEKCGLVRNLNSHGKAKG